jgi:hypothetical protein
MRMELLQPLRIVHVRLAARDVLDGAGVDQQHLEAVGLQELEHGDPVHACRFHRHGGDADLRQPVGQVLEIAAERPERAHRLVVPFLGHGDDMKRRAHVDAGGMPVDGG